MSGHEIAVEGPLRYPGGKDGTYRSTCSCGRYSSGYGYPTPEAALKPAMAHKEAKEKDQ